MTSLIIMYDSTVLNMIFLMEERKLHFFCQNFLQYHKFLQQNYNLNENDWKILCILESKKKLTIKMLSNKYLQCKFFFQIIMFTILK
jgi:hypothetical protein